MIGEKEEGDKIYERTMKENDILKIEVKHLKEFNKEIKREKRRCEIEAMKEKAKTE